MKVALSLTAAVVSASELGTSDTIAKLVSLLGDCEAKVMKEGEEAQKVYTEFAEWCEDRAKDLRYEVKTAKRSSDELKATIFKESNAQQVSTTQIENVAADIASDEQDLAAATKLRNQEKADFRSREKDLVDVIDTLGRAISVIEREQAKGGAAMMQLKSAKSLTQVFKVMVQANSLNTADAQKLTAFVQNSNSDGDDELGAPAGSVYENQSGGIFDVLQSLRDKSTEQLDASREAEKSAANNYEMLRQSLQDEIKFANKEMSDAKKGVATSQEAQGVAEGDLDVTQKDLAEDSSTLADLHHECMSRSQDFETQAKSRSEELRGLAQAKDAVKQVTVRSEGQYDFKSFLQISLADEPARSAVHMMRGFARKTKDPLLAQLASRMAFTVAQAPVEAAAEAAATEVVANETGAVEGAVEAQGNQTGGGTADVFAALKKQILESIKKLNDEEDADATHKVFCDKNLAEATVKVEDKAAEIEKHTAKIEQKSSGSLRVKAEVATLQQEEAKMVAAKLAMDVLRQKEKGDYDYNNQETEKSLTEIKYALKVLRDFYGNYQKEHTGFSSSDGVAQGVMAMLETVESEFSTNLVKMNAAEEAAVNEYTDATKAFEVGKVIKEKDIKYKTKEHLGLDNYAREETSDRDGTQQELDANHEALAKLKQMCTGKLLTYEVRVARREEEMADLKETLESLEAGFSFVQRSVKRFRGGVRTRTA